MKPPLIGHAALGFRVHSGWAVLVVLAGPVETPTILDRRRIEMADVEMAGSKQPYHAAQQLNLREAANLIAACVEASVRLAEKAVKAALDDAIRKSFRVSACGVPIGSGRPLPTLEKILPSHPLLHTAEGELFRNAIMTACRNYGLSVTSVKEKEAWIRSSLQLGISQAGIQHQLARMGKAIGPPWRQDEKSATLAAWLALAADAQASCRGRT
ncbi:MAG TPA: hypothetical protein VF772_14390 [Terriglobales bacterium]